MASHLLSALKQLPQQFLFPSGNNFTSVLFSVPPSLYKTHLPAAVWLHLPQPVSSPPSGSSAEHSTCSGPELASI